MTIDVKARANELLNEAIQKLLDSSGTPPSADDYESLMDTCNAQAESEYLAAQEKEIKDSEPVGFDTEKYKALVEMCDTVQMHMKPKRSNYLFYRNKKQIGEMSIKEGIGWLSNILHKKFIQTLNLVEGKEDKYFMWQKIG